MSQTATLPVQIVGGPCDGKQIEVRAGVTPMGRPVLPLRIELLGEARWSEYGAPLSPPRYTYDLTGPDSTAYWYVPQSAGPVRPGEEPTT
jgi:hypothetical protein